MPTRDFEASRRERAVAREPIMFKLRGHDFHCADSMPWNAYEKLLEIVEVRVDKPGGKPGEKVTSVSMKVGPFLRGCVVDDDQELLEQVLASRYDPVDLEEITDICNWLMEVYTGRPTERPADSSDGPSTTSRSLRRVNFSEGTVEEIPSGT